MPALTFQHAVLLFPLATLAHVVEEWPGFPRWARRFASPAYSDRQYVATHALTVVTALAAAILASRVPRPVVLFLAFALVFAPAGLWNGVFHAAASLASGSFCPGAITGLVLYAPLVVLLAVLAQRDALLSPASLAAAFSIGLALHVLEVGHGVFKRW